MAIAKGPYQELAQHPHGLHLMAAALMGTTRDCLRAHGIELDPAMEGRGLDTRRELARLHLKLHST